MKILGIFDRNPTSVGIRSTHTTLIGSVIGIIILLILAALFISKLVSVINYESLYLNYWRTE